MKKKFIATLMVGAMAASLFAGCGVQQTGGSSQASSEKTEDKAEEKTDGTEAASEEVGGSDLSADIT